MTALSHATDPRYAASRRLFERAQRVIPGGVNSPVRAFQHVGGTPLFIASAEGSTVTDADGNRYLDFVGSWGPMLFGHNHPAIRDAVTSALGEGTSFGAPTMREAELAERVCAFVPSVERVRLVNSGTEATMSAIRVARAFTGRNKVLKFRGGYHGHADAFLIEAGSGAATLGVPSSPGVPAAVALDTLNAEYNDLRDVERVIAQHGNDLACIIVEPVSGNMGCVPPAPGFLEGLRTIATAHGALLVFDEVMTGFRLARGGAQERFGIVPDLTTLGKIIGGGLPVGAYGGRADAMALVAPQGPVYQAGTLAGNPLATAAGIAMLELIAARPTIYDQIEQLGTQLDVGLATIIGRLRAPVTWQRVGSMGSLFFTPTPVRNWDEASRSDKGQFTRFFWAMLRRDVYIAPSPWETLFLSAAHTNHDINRMLEAVEASLREEFAT